MSGATKERCGTPLILRQACLPAGRLSERNIGVRKADRTSGTQRVTRAGRRTEWALAAYGQTALGLQARCLHLHPELPALAGSAPTRARQPEAGLRRRLHYIYIWKAARNPLRG